MRRNKFKLTIIILILVFCYTIYRVCNRIYAFNYKYDELSSYKNINVLVLSLEKSSEEKITYLVKYKDDKFLLNIYNNEEDKNFILKNSSYKYLDILNITAKKSADIALNNPYEFNYKRYLNSNNIVCQITAYNVERQGRHSKYNISYLVYCFKEFLSEKIINKLDEKHGNFFKSLIYSDDLNLDEDIKTNFNNIGASFMLTTSGTHIIYLMYVLNSLIQNKSNKYKYFLIVVLVLFLIFSGQGISILRAVISQILVIIFDILNIKKSRYKRFFLTAFILLSYNFYYIFNPSFILSFSCILSIMLFSNLISSFFRKLLYLGILKKYRYKQNNLFCFCINKIVNIIALNLSVIIGTFPIQINYFHNFNILSIVYNIPLSILASLEYSLGFLALFLSFIPFVSDILILANYILLDILIKLAEVFNNYKILFNLPHFNIFEFICYYINIFIILYKIYILKKKTKKKRINISKILFIISIISFIFLTSFQIYKLYFEDFVIFFNVSQGNMALIRQDRKTIVIDMGSTSKTLASNVLRNFLKARAIKNVDLLILTHFHLDHVNGIYNLSEDINIKNIGYLEPKSEFEVEEEYQKVNQYISKNNISKISLSSFDTIEFKNIKIISIMPENNEIINSTDIANSNSVIFLISVKDKNYLFMGDATVESEEYYIKNFSNISYKKLKEEIKEKLNNIYALQVGHHGSSTSTSEEFLKCINVKYAIISCKKSVYGHPSLITLEALKKFNIEYYITEESGAIKF